MHYFDKIKAIFILKIGLNFVKIFIFTYELADKNPTNNTNKVLKTKIYNSSN